MRKHTLILAVVTVLPSALLLWLISLFPVGLMGVGDVPLSSAAGTVITVTMPDDAGAGSLRAAIETVNLDMTDTAYTITFDADYTITLASALPNLSRTSGPVTMLGDRGTGTPRTVLDGSALGAGYSGLRVTGDGWRIQGFVVMNVTNGFGVTLRGNDNVLSHNYIGLSADGSEPRSNGTGVLLTDGAHDNLLNGNWIGGNLGHGVSLFSTYVTATAVITPSHHNTVTQNYIGLNPTEGPTGNSNKGVIIHMGSHDNYIGDNRILGNSSYGVYLYGGSDGIDGLEPGVFPPVGNEIVSNTITGNNQVLSQRQGAIVSDRTHRATDNVVPTASSGYDNLIASNLIQGNLAAGIYNVGASPLISGNHILTNTNFAQGWGIYNIVYLGTDAGGTPGTVIADDDVLSIPYITNNDIDGNSGTGIISLDTAPVRRYELTTGLGNTIGENGNADVDQIWYAGVEVLTGTLGSEVPITTGIEVSIYKGDGSDRYVLDHNDAVDGSAIWNDNAADTYADVTSWPQVREYSVDLTGTLDSWLTHTVEVDLGSIKARVHYAFDGLTATKPVSDTLLPAFRVTGPYARYQIAEVNFAYDTDQDGIPDVIEGDDGVDTDGDGTPDYQDTDSDGDGIPDSVEGYQDSDGDGIPDFQDPDDDGDGIPTKDECSDPEDCQDSDGDGIPDYLDPDDDGDGIPTADECSDPEDCQDTDGDGIPDYLDPDDDGDGIPTADECSDPEDCQDTDGDGTPDYLDPDDDGDGVPTAEECSDPEACEDSDGDGIPDYLDADDDGDGIPTAEEYNDPDDPDDDFCSNDSQDSDGDGIPDCQDNDADGDGVPNYLDEDSDGDGMPDAEEGTGDSDGDGIPNWLDPHYYLRLPIVIKRFSVTGYAARDAHGR